MFCRDPVAPQMRQSRFRGCPSRHLTLSLLSSFAFFCSARVNFNRAKKFDDESLFTMEVRYCFIQVNANVQKVNIRFTIVSPCINPGYYSLVECITVLDTNVTPWTELEMKFTRLKLTVNLAWIRLNRWQMAPKMVIFILPLNHNMSICFSNLLDLGFTLQ
jgi:hypothetical protein